MAGVTDRNSVAAEEEHRRPSLKIRIPQDTLYSRDSSSSPNSGNSAASGPESPESEASEPSGSQSPQSPQPPRLKSSASRPAPTKPVANLPEVGQPQPGQNVGRFITLVRPPPAPSNIDNESSVPSAAPPPPPPPPPPQPATSSVKNSQIPAVSEVASTVSRSVEATTISDAAISQSAIPKSTSSLGQAEKQSDTAKVDAPSNPGLGRAAEVGIVFGTIAFVAIFLGAGLMLYYRRKPKRAPKEILTRAISVSKSDISKPQPQTQRKKQSIYARSSRPASQRYNALQPPVRTVSIPAPVDRPLPPPPARQSTTQTPVQTNPNAYPGEERLGRYRTATPIPVDLVSLSEDTRRT